MTKFVQPVSTGDGWSLVHGDCLVGLRELEDDSVDVVITDPPYEAEAHTKARRTKTRDWRTAHLRGQSKQVAITKPLPFDAISDEQRNDAAGHMSRVARRWILVFCQVEASQLWSRALEIGGAQYIRTMVWVKPDGQPQFTGDRPGVGYESIVVAHQPGEKHWNGGGRLGVFECSKNAGRPNGNGSLGPGIEPAPHPTTKPQPLMRELVSLFSDPGELVLDPFAGSGTTGVACRQLGRRFLGWEMNDNYHAIACRRLRGEAARIHETQLDLLAGVCK